MTTRRRLHRGIMRDHAEELAMMHERRTRWRDDPEVSFEALATLEERMAAHVDGLVLGGRDAIDLLDAQFASGRGDQGDLYVWAATIASHGHLRSDGSDRSHWRRAAEAVVQLCARIGEKEVSSESCVSAVAAGIGDWVASEGLVDFGEVWCGAGPMATAVAARVLADRRADLVAAIRRIPGGEPEFALIDRFADHVPLDGPGLTNCVRLSSRFPGATRLARVVRGRAPTIDRDILIAELRRDWTNDWAKDSTQTVFAELSESLETSWVAPLAACRAGSEHAIRLETRLERWMASRPLDATPATVVALALLGRSESRHALVAALGEPTLAAAAGVGLHLLSGLDLFEQVRLRSESPESANPEDRDLDRDLGLGLSVGRICTQQDRWEHELRRLDWRDGVRYRMGVPANPAADLRALASTRLPGWLRTVIAEECFIRYGIDLGCEPDAPVVRLASALERARGSIIQLAREGRRFEAGVWYLHGCPLDARESTSERERMTAATPDPAGRNPGENIGQGATFAGNVP